MLSSLLTFALVTLAVLVSSADAQAATTWGFCFKSSSLADSPYGPWSVATGGLLTVSAPFFFNDSGTAASGGGMRWAQTVTAATVSRTQYNRDGTTSQASLVLGTKGVQGSDMLFFNSTPYTDWNGINFAVVSSTDMPFSGATGSNSWIVYPNDFPVREVELYYDLPAYNYPTEYHHDNQTNAVMTVQVGSAPSCTPDALPQAQQPSALTYQFCYQAYGAAAGSVPAWQVAIQGTFLTKTSASTSAISGQSGLYILTVTGTRTQTAGSNTTTTPIVGQTWHNSGGGDANEYGDDPLLMTSSPYLVPGKGFVFYTGFQFAYANGTVEAVDNYYARVNALPMAVSGSSVYERQGPTPDWSGFAVQCGCSLMTCPLITASANAATSGVVNASSCIAVSKSMSPSGATCSTSGNNNNGAAHTAVGTATLLLALATAAVMAQ